MCVHITILYSETSELSQVNLYKKIIHDAIEDPDLEDPEIIVRHSP